MKSKMFFILVCLLPAVSINAQTYKIDAGHSTIQVQVQRFGVVDVTGRFKAVTGTISFDADSIANTKANVKIEVNSYDANNVGGEAAVKSKAFLDAETYPEILFEGTGAVVKNKQYYLQGNLTIHGVTKAIELPFTIIGPFLDLPTQKQSIAFNASITINRQDYGITFNRKLPNGTPLVSDQIQITIKVLGIGT